MTLDALTPEDDIFSNEDALRDHYPDRILERDQKLQEYVSMLQEVVRNKRPRNVFVYGPTGVGKTIATKAIIEHLHDSIDEYDYSEIDIDEPSLKTIHLDCKHLNTSYQVAVHLVNELRKNTDRDPISTTGYPASDIYQFLFDELRDVDETHVIVALDEIDSIGDDDDLLYKLPRCNDNNSAQVVDPANTKIGVIGITNDGKFLERVDPRARSTLSEQEIHFPPYDANELQTIVEDRANQAFHDGALLDEVVPLVSALAAQRSGYARTALDLLFEAGALARRNQVDTVTADHARKAEENIQRGAIVTEIEGLSTHGKIVTYTLLRLSEADELPSKIDKVHAWYEKHAEILDINPVTSRTVHNTLNDLMINGVVTSKEVNKGRSGGRHYEYDLDVRKNLVISGLQDDNTISRLDDDRFA